MSNNFIIADAEVRFLSQMIQYLSEEGNSLSDNGSQEVQEVLDRINSRPHVQAVIDLDKLSQIAEGSKNV